MKTNRKKIEPKGILSFVTYLSDRGGVGHIRSILPNLIMGSWRYKQMSFEPINLSFFIQDMNFYRKQLFVKFQRSATRDQLNLIKQFKQMVKTPVLYEIDDLLFDIPKSNFASDFYEHNKPYIEEILRTVNGITVSTLYLKEKYKKYNKNISIVPNRLAKCLWGDIKECESKERKKPRILYPGSMNHFSQNGSGGDFGKDLIKFINKTKKDKYEWVFVGGIPHELKDDKDIIYYKWIDYMSYTSFMKNLNVDIAIAPLEVCEFNRGKSNLKMLEYGVCGIPAVYTNIEPYKNATLKADNEKEMIDKIEWLSNTDNQYDVWKKDIEKIKNNLFLENNRLKWLNEHMKLFNKVIV